MVSVSLYFYFSMFDLHRSIPVLSQFKHNHGTSDHGPRSSDGMDLSFYGTDRRWWVHALSRSAVGLSQVVCTKLFLMTSVVIFIQVASLSHTYYNIAVHSDT